MPLPNWERRETLDDPFIVEPGEPPTSLIIRSGPVARGKFVSVQVNVDANGSNIAGDAANEPSIAIDPTDPNRIAIGWRQFNNVSSNFRQAGRAYSHDRGQTWTFPGVLQPGQFRSDPVLDSDAEGNFYYYSLSTLGSAELFKSIDGGVSWTGPIPAWGGDKAWMVIDKTDGIGRGNIYAAWSPFYGCCVGEFTRSIDGGNTFAIPIVVPLEPFWGTLAVGPDGAVYVSGFGVIVAKSSQAQDPSSSLGFDFSTFVNLGGFGAFATGPNPGGLLGQVNIAVDHSDGPLRGNVYVLSSVHLPGPDPLDVMFSRSTDGGLTWSSPIRVNDDSTDNEAWQWFGTMSVAPNGRIDVIWNDTRGSSNLFISEVYYSSSSDGGITWSENTPVSPPFNSSLGWPNQAKLGDYYHMISENGRANLAYAATFNGEQDIYFLSILIDCNGNGVGDDEDIASNKSRDCNQNAVPDECEPQDDCNANSIQDICDVFEGTSEDCNHNLVPDQCEEDCNGTGVPDDCDVTSGTSQDCNQNQRPDECESTEDCDGNGRQDICDVFDDSSLDCNGNDAIDECDIASGASDDCNANGRPDECDLVDPCDISVGSCPGEGSCCDPAGNGTPGCECGGCCAVVCDLDPFCCDFEWDGICAAVAAALPACNCDGTAQVSDDCNDNGVPDECEPQEDCNLNGRQDICDVVDTCGPPIGACPGSGACCDLSGNGTPGCECSACCAVVCKERPSCCDTLWDQICAIIALLRPVCRCDDPISDDCNSNDVPDECEPETDCNGNGERDICEVAAGGAVDCDADGVLDECEVDSDSDGSIDDCDGCPMDPTKTSPGICGCGESEIDNDNDSVPDCQDLCPGDDDLLDTNADGVPDCLDRSSIPTVTGWGLAILSLLFLAIGRIAYAPKKQVPI